MGFYTWIFIITMVLGTVFIYILMNHFTKAIRLILEAFATFIEVIGMHNQNSEKFRQGEGPDFSSDKFKAEADRLRKLMNASSIFK